MPVLDQIIRAIEASIEELLREVERLRGALAALVPGSEPAGVKTSKDASSAAKRPRAATRRAPRTRTASVPPRSAAAAPARARTAPGATKAAVLAALGDGRAMTAGEIAAATGLGRATVSTTLSKLRGFHGSGKLKSERWGVIMKRHPQRGIRIADGWWRRGVNDVGLRSGARSWRSRSDRSRRSRCLLPWMSFSGCTGCGRSAISAGLRKPRSVGG
jgi:DNA-binding transcriptional ArsR family regulator